MFTGIVEEIGEVVSFELVRDILLWDGSRGDCHVLVIRCSKALEGAYIGCSIAVNGVCLTATELDESSFTAHVAPETLRRTNLGACKPGDGVDLERSATASDRVSGHMVQGHVDCAARVVSKTADGASCLTVELEVPAEHSRLMRYVVEKGYVALEGASLTVCSVDRQARRFSVMLIPHTQRAIVLPRREVGALVNVEADAVGKYAVDAADGALAGAGPGPVAWASLGVSVAALGLAAWALARTFSSQRA